MPFSRPQGYAGCLRKKIGMEASRQWRKAGRAPRGGPGEALTQKPQEEAVSGRGWSSHQRPPRLRSCPWVYQIGGPQPSLPIVLGAQMQWAGETPGHGEVETVSLNYSEQGPPLPTALPPFCTEPKTPGGIRNYLVHHYVPPAQQPAQKYLKNFLK